MFAGLDKSNVVDIEPIHSIEHRVHMKRYLLVMDNNISEFRIGLKTRYIIAGG